MKEIFLPENQIIHLLDSIEQEYQTTLFTSEDIIRYRELSEEDKRQISFREPRSPFPAKSFFLPAKERVAEYGTEVKQERETSTPEPPKPPALVGLRNCDVEAIAILDQIFLEGDFIDPCYRQRRDSILIVTVDCVSITEFCFCHTLGYQPFVKEGRGLNLSPLKGGFVVRADTPAGERILEPLSPVSSPVEVSRKEEVEQSRQAALALLRESNEKFATTQSYHDILCENPPSEKWNDLFNSCVECAACTNICPTCYCFYLFDRRRFPDRQDTFERLRTWDSCLLADYSRMAGIGGVKPNPRPQIRARYANRFRHKYLYHYDTYGQYGCTGCGRCSQSCMGTTDPREVMRVLGQ